MNFRDVLCLYSKLLDGILLGGGDPLLLVEFSLKSVDVLLSLITVGSSQDNLNAYEIAEQAKDRKRAKKVERKCDFLEPPCGQNLQYSKLLPWMSGRARAGTNWLRF